eukprot:4527895-Prymnesium_polylepis.1
MPSVWRAHPLPCSRRRERRRRLRAAWLCVSCMHGVHAHAVNGVELVPAPWILEHFECAYGSPSGRAGGGGRQHLELFRYKYQLNT